MTETVRYRCRLVVSLVLCVFGVFIPAICIAQNASRIDQVVQSYASAGKFMGAVLIARGDTVIFSKGYGSANLEWNIPNTPSTRFRIGSLTKQFTAASILFLEQQGKLRTDAPIKNYLPNAPAAWNGIKIFNLLTHTAGIPDYTDFPEFESREAFPATPDQIISWFIDKPLEFAPGQQFRYSNSNYIVLGRLIEKLSGQTYAQFLQDHIFTPLGMKDSGYDSAQIVRNRATGYAPSAKGPVNAGFIDMSVPFAAGGLYSTPEDLLRWERGLFGGKVISTASRAKMTTPFKSEYAFGVAARMFNGRRALAHNGGIQGFNCWLGYWPDHRVTVAILANLNGRAPDDLGPILGALAFGETKGGKEAMTGGLLGLVGLVVVMLLFRLVGSAFKEKSK